MVFKASPPFDGGEPVKPLKQRKSDFLMVWEPFWGVRTGAPRAPRTPKSEVLKAPETGFRDLQNRTVFGAPYGTPKTHPLKIGPGPILGGNQSMYKFYTDGWTPKRSLED